MSESAGPRLSARSAFVLLLALVVAIIGGVLSYLSVHDLPAAVLVAGLARGPDRCFTACLRARLSARTGRPL